MKRFLAAALTLTFAASIFAATSDPVANLLEPTVNSVIDSDDRITTSDANRCCWIYIWGAWWCIPCG